MVLGRERCARGWSKARLAREAGLRRETLARLEAGVRSPAPDTVFRLEAALDLEPGTLVPAWPEWSPARSPSPGAAARRRRRALGLTLDEVAARAGTSAATLSRFERQETATPSLILTERSEAGGKWEHLRSDALARALGFADARAFMRWSDQEGSCPGEIDQYDPPADLVT